MWPGGASDDKRHDEPPTVRTLPARSGRSAPVRAPGWSGSTAKTRKTKSACLRPLQTNSPRSGGVGETQMERYVIRLRDLPHRGVVPEPPVRELRRCSSLRRPPGRRPLVLEHRTDPEPGVEQEMRPADTPAFLVVRRIAMSRIVRRHESFSATSPVKASQRMRTMEA